MLPTIVTTSATPRPATIGPTTAQGESPLIELPPIQPRPWPVQRRPTTNISTATEKPAARPSVTGPPASPDHLRHDSSRLRILPVAVIGSDRTNSTVRGYLYAAIWS